MPSQRMYQVQDFDVQRCAEALVQWYQGQGYEAQVLPSPGGVTVQARQAKSLVQKGVAVQTQFVLQGENLSVQVGTGQWVLHTVSNVAAAILFWPLLGLTGYAAYKQKEIIDETWAFIERYIATGGEVPLPPVSAMEGAPTQATPGRTLTCPSCGATVREGAKFCDHCGARLIVTCPQCGAELRPGAKFCDNCGARLEAADQEGSQETADTN